MKLVDSHCHINFDPLCDDFEGIMNRARENRVEYMLCVAVNLEDYPQVEKLASENDNIFCSVGVHPNYTDCHDPDVEELLALAANPNVVAIGETGLDYFRTEDEDMGWQHRRFQNHIEAARLCHKPLILHTRSAAVDTIKMLKNERADECGGVMHCFAEDWETAKQALDIGFYISFSGIVTFKNAETLRDVARNTPLDRILVETDSPYLAPVPFRGKTNEPSLVKYTAEKVAELKNVSLEALAEKTTENFFNLFSSASPNPNS